MLVTAVIVLTLIVEDYLKRQDFEVYFPRSLEGTWYLSSAVEMRNKILHNVDFAILCSHLKKMNFLFN